MRCPNCGTETEANFCPNCGTNMSGENVQNSGNIAQMANMRGQNFQNQTPSAGQGQYYQNYAQNMNGQYQPPMNKKTSGMSIVAFILSFLGCIGVVGAILGIIDLARSGKEMPPKKHGLSVAAIVIGILMLILSMAIRSNNESSSDVSDT